MLQKFISIVVLKTYKEVLSKPLDYWFSCFIETKLVIGWLINLVAGQISKSEKDFIKIWRY